MTTSTIRTVDLDGVPDGLRAQKLEPRAPKGAA
jgi:hypothetical protein